MICALLGVPYADHDFFQENSRSLVRTSTPTEQRNATLQWLLRYLDHLVGAKIDEPGDDREHDRAGNACAPGKSRPA